MQEQISSPVSVVRPACCVVSLLAYLYTLNAIKMCETQQKLSWVSVCVCCVWVRVRRHRSVHALHWYAVCTSSRNIKGSFSVCVCGWWIGLWSLEQSVTTLPNGAQTHSPWTGHFRISDTLESQRKQCYFCFFYILFPIHQSFCSDYWWQSPLFSFVFLYATTEGDCLHCWHLSSGVKLVSNIEDWPGAFCDCKLPTCSCSEAAFSSKGCGDGLSVTQSSRHSPNTAGVSAADRWLC